MVLIPINVEGSTERKIPIIIEGSAEKKTHIDVEGSAEKKLHTDVKGSREKKIHIDVEGSEEKKLHIDVEGSEEKKLHIDVKGSAEKKLHIDVEASTKKNNGPKDKEATMTTGQDDIVVFKLRSFGDYAKIDEKNSTVVTNSSIKIKDFLANVAEKMNTPTDELELVYQEKSTGNIYHLSKFTDTKINELGILPSETTVYSLSVEKRRKKIKKLYFDEEDIPTESPETVGQGLDSPEASSSDMPGRRCQRRLSFDDLRREFVGLKNQNSTCYLNSLLQALFFCPELRNALYLHNFKYDPERKSIGTALQHLFLQLQFSSRWSVDTENITKTFGWKDNEYTVQHDIEELFRILMDALGEEFKKSHLYSITDSLFGGTMNDYVECLSCHKKNVKKSFFTALHLPVSLYGKPLPEPTLEESLRQYVTAELLCDKNQYRCENCDKLVDANKGLAFEKLPYFICLLLQRSEFDYNSMSRKKCCNMLTFPQILNMNPFTENNESKDATEDSIHPVEIQDIRGAKYDPSLRTTHSRPQVTLGEVVKINESDNSEEETAKMLEEGPNVYQLLSILIHRGRSSIAGHYYSYCYDLETKKWNMFNDSSVHKINPNDISLTYGGPENEQGGLAYMLMYRRIDPNLNSLPLTRDELPAEVVDLWASMEKEEEEAQSRETVENQTMHVEVYLRESHCWEPQEKELVLSRADSMAASAAKCYKEFYPDATSTPESLRLVRYNQKKGFMDMTFDTDEETTIGSLARKLKGVLMLEVLPDDVQRDPYLTNDLVFKTHFVDSQNDNVLCYKEIHGRVKKTVGQLKMHICKYFKKAPVKLAMILETSSNRYNLEEHEEAELGSLDVRTGNVYDLFVEDLSLVYVSNLSSFVENYYNSMIFEVVCDVHPQEPDAENSIGTPNGTSYDNELLFANSADCPEEPIRKGDASNGTIELGPTSDISKQSKAETEMIPGSKENMLHGLHYFRILESHDLNTRSKRLLVKAGKSMSMEFLSRELREGLHIGDQELIMHKVQGGIEEEIFNYNVSLQDLGFDSLRGKPGRRLRNDEGRVYVFLLDLKSPTDNPKLICDVVFNTSMTVKNARVLIDQILTKSPDTDQDFSKSYRLRKKNLTNPSRVMKDTQLIKEFLPIASGDIFVQPVCPEFLEYDQSEDRWHCMVLFLWKPSDLTLLPPIEIMFKYDYTCSLEALLATKISEQFGLSKEELEVARPEADFPCDLNPIVIHEKLEWFRLDNSSHKHISIHNDEGILFVRDKSEPLKTLLPEDRDVLEKEAMVWRGEYTIPIPKKKSVDREIGLKINLARSPPIVK